MASIHCFFRYPVQLNTSTSTSTSRVPFSSFSFNCLRCSSSSSSVDAHAAANKNVGDDVFSVTSSSEYDVDYLGESTKGDFNLNFDRLQPFGIDGEAALDGPIEEVARMEAQEADHLLNDFGIPSPSSARNSPRGIFCSRTLNLRSISAIGYDMDYTLMHYNVMAWEGRAYDYCMVNLRNMGFPVEGLAFDPDLVIRGLVIDKEKGNLVKADRFGYVKRAMHGTTMLSNRAVRWSTDWMKELLDPNLVPLIIKDFIRQYVAVGKALFRAHVEGQLKSEIMSKPELFVEPDPELPLALLDQKEVIVSARKPEFFQMSHPLYEVVTGEGLMRPCFKARTGGLYSGGSAQMIENSLNIHGDEILYVGDHIYTDVSQSKVHLRWRTALICRELEEETLAATNMDDQELTESMQKLLVVMQRLDQKIAPMLESDGELFNKRWGFLSRAGLWDKSHLMRQIEKYADIYTSRVSNFLHYTPFMYFRSQEQTLAHDSYSYYCSERNDGSVSGVIDN
ncbi:HAD-superfamily hydrolase subfamily IG 5'-nucleotidase [Citrus sinensis]|nr:HAD-superfamily hydrolase subfamily IG 5'-nucleotidase [Citrus sinensis]